MANKSIIDGFSFADDADVSLASSEIEKIKYIAGKMNMDNPRGVLAVYDKLITSGIFVTPVGYEYLRTLQSYLYKCKDIPDDAVKEIPVPISYTRALNLRSEERDERIQADRQMRTLRKTFRTEYKVSLIVNIILIIMVIAMFVITLKAENPNMINYRTAILNQYSEWEQELNEREAAIKQRELELEKE
ncbi:MAG: hypothetical protein E7298_01520 [Lachnospiraceae bacterium]|nr:hypothetical protein [Lachnospiraceae bacterium]MBQ6320140.1 hypothetical protein [Lachnospiraceae bacterium]MBQ8006229.1 hypothetical protein [Lachnospiraceae bacterium]MBQ8667059.1 hypothetical protein [Lachnospiraceae bacterium]